jgi:hypothetical protein
MKASEGDSFRTRRNCTLHLLIVQVSALVPYGKKKQKPNKTHKNKTLAQEFWVARTSSHETETSLNNA